MSELPTLNIGIPAYNEEANIGKLIKLLLKQKRTLFQLNRIIVSSDGSADNTVSESKFIKNKKVTVFDNKDRRGIARGINQIIDSSDSDILVTLDADINILNRNFLNKLIRPIVENNADLTSSSIYELPAGSFMQKVLKTGMMLKNNYLFKTFKDGNNIYNCHGLARAYSNKYYKTLHLPVSIGNDMYTYLKAIKDGFTFIYTPEAKAYYKLPEKLSDHRMQSERFFVTEEEMQNLFGKKLIAREVTIPAKVYFKAGIKAFPFLLTHPFTSLAYFLIQQYFRIKPKSQKARLQAWNMAVSSKKLN